MAYFRKICNLKKLPENASMVVLEISRIIHKSLNLTSFEKYFNRLGFLDEHVICASGQCRCEPNFYYNKTSNNCLKYICRENKDCQEYDHNRYCVIAHGKHK